MTMPERQGVALVTGASRGIGAAIARRLARDGMAVACGATTEANADGIARELRDELGATCLPVGIEVSDPISVQDAVERVEAALGPVGLLVNNAGIAGVTPFLDLEFEQFRRVIDVNLHGVFLCSQAVARRMVATGTHGSIIHIGSIAGVTGFPNRMGYVASKAAVRYLTKVMALDLAEAGIRVNCVAPGYVRTDMITDLAEAGLLDEDALRRRIPMGRLGGVDEVAAAVAWLASSEAGYVTGETLVLDGGWVAYGHV
jgi:NAD(P)-dependent dehydrogenase (short-subunit alcohol dehydrogenase family)